MDENSLNELAQQIDEAVYYQDKKRLISLSVQVAEFIKTSSGSQLTTILYWQSNIYSALAGEDQKLENINLEKQLGSLRTALSSEGFDQVNDQFKVQILTNLGTLLTDQGRYCEAIEHYDNALRLSPKYALSNANRARCLMGFARLVNDAVHQHMLLWAAQSSFKNASTDDAIFEDERQLFTLKPDFKRRAIGISSAIDAEYCQSIIDDDDVGLLGQSEPERSYRSFCLQNALFLNPLNDAYKHPVVATDVVSISSIMKRVDDTNAHPPLEFSLFNRIKQEYTTARYFYHDALTSEGIHFSDREVKLANTYDYTRHGLAFEKLRVAYRYAYSVLDRIALLINHYWSLGHETRKISFSGIWYKPRKNSRPVHPVVSATENSALRALFELSKDLHSKERKSFSEPDARLLADLRNALEHRFVEITDDVIEHLEKYVDVPNSERVRIPLSILESKTMRMLKLTRSACIYLPMALNFEEQGEENLRSGLYGQTTVETVHDKDKRR